MVFGHIVILIDSLEVIKECKLVQTPCWTPPGALKVQLIRCTRVAGNHSIFFLQNNASIFIILEDWRQAHYVISV